MRPPSKEVVAKRAASYRVGRSNPRPEPRLMTDADIEKRDIELAQDAWVQLKTKPDWDRWITVGRVIETAQRHAMRESNSNRPSGKAYSAVFGKWLRENKFDDLDKGTRSNLMDCMASLVEIEAWRKTLSDDKRMKFNHPSTVLRQWRAHARETEPAKAKEATTLTIVQQQLAMVTAERDALRKQGGGSSFHKSDTPDAIAKVIVSDLHGVSADKLGRIKRALDIEIQAAIERQKKP